MPRAGIEPATRGFSVLCSTNWAIWAFLLMNFSIRQILIEKRHKKIAGAGFEPTTFGLWARRASRLLHPASIFTFLLYTISIKISIPILNGWRWIRTTEACRNRFTVCPLWPLGNPSIWNWLSPKPMIGLEPITCWLQISCSANWATSANEMGPIGLEPMTLCL